ncbi:hypothetical protein C1I93_18385 [Micromonospora endophytica]|uniref:Uncharacterized protein n=1 Tax=Micromonospora endophytica TaxID=515350 RepID=A0A2W2CYW7_9ACTN|nr:hypothetical protein [Micromonospora endophytica]PZF93097.1 hypothetical protein C1I93_18385 [Micromonospora endophytica]RIW45403.1 hypothetical protein D3H59_15045 [Micromonospora endophytica]BCJ58529.1 hypothetical protein Jiend_19510 [Micromonospora endophytica]
MIASLTGRVRALRTTVSRITLTPLLIRLGIFLAALLGLLLAYPAELVAGQALGALVVGALLPALAPRWFWPTFVALVTVAGWLLATDGYDRPIALWRLLAVAVALYLTHTLAALAALLPYDAVVDPDLIVRWLTRTAGVLLATSVLAVLLLELARIGGGGAGWQAVTVAGLLVACAVTALLAWLLRRR